MPIVRVTMFKGRTHEQKAELARRITEVVVEVAKAPPEGTIIVFDEVDQENYATRGVLVSDRPK